MENDCLSPFKTRAELEAAANQTSQLAPGEHRHATYLYYLARYFVAMYEARFSEIPIQVWNEYRNALDHFYRHMTRTNEAELSHLKKMEGHVQRAVLDIAKIFCHDSSEEFEHLLAKESDECLRLVDNGNFYTNLIKKKASVKLSFMSAKTCDSALGESASTDNDVLSRYLDACYGYIDLFHLLDDRRTEIDHVTYEYKNLEARAVKKAEVHGFWGHVKASITAKIIIALAGTAFAYFLYNWLGIRLNP